MYLKPHLSAFKSTDNYYSFSVLCFFSFTVSCNLHSNAYFLNNTLFTILFLSIAHAQSKKDNSIRGRRFHSICSALILLYRGFDFVEHAR